MKCYDEQLSQLQEQCARKKKLEASVKELIAQQESYTSRTKELQQLLSEKQAVVEQLEN